MTRLPLFPLNTVLFPGMPLTLHIFEPRYRKMIHDALAHERRFGVVLIEEGQEALGPLAQPHRVGCAANIMQITPLGDGRMNLVAMGGERFRVDALDSTSEPYLMGEVSFEPMLTARLAPSPMLWELRPLVKTYLEILSKVGSLDLELDQLPTDPLDLANLGAYVLRVGAEEKQPLLEADTSIQFITALNKLLRRENAIMGNMLQHQDLPDDQPFSWN
ncbi:MAG: LON peptidase substrate-binding domain-containing protein [Phototrophicaceae bacterium]